MSNGKTKLPREVVQRILNNPYMAKLIRVRPLSSRYTLPARKDKKEDNGNQQN